MRNIPKPIVKGTRTATGIPPHNNIAWLEKHHQKYTGKWIALHDGHLLGANESFIELRRAIKKADQLRLAVFINLKLGL